MTDKAEHLTREQKSQLETELATLEGPKRAEIVEAIATARGFGDLSEISSTTPPRTSKACSSVGSRSCATD